MKLSLKVLAANFICSLFCLNLPAQADGSKNSAAITFEYRNETISPDFRNWVAKYGARAPTPYKPKATLEDYVKQACNNTASTNVQLFKQSLSEQGVSVDKENRVSAPKDGTLMLPPCLPVPTRKPVAKVVFRGDRLWDFIDQGGLPASYDITAVEAFTPRPMTLEPNRSTAEVSDDSLADILARYLERPNISGGDSGEVAYKALLTANDLKLAGFKETEIKKQVYEKIEPETATPQFKAGFEAALKRWPASQFTSQQWENLLKTKGTDLSKPIWLNPNSTLGKKPTALQPGDIVITPTQAVQSVQIPIDYALLSRSSSADAADFLKANPPPKPTVEIVENKPGVALLDTQPIDGMLPETCDAASYKQWGNAAFAREFAAAALRTRILAYRLGVRGFTATVVIVDSGFVKAKESGAFSDDAFSQVAELLHEQDAPASLGAKRAHGTIVAGLILGGPQLWGTPSALGIDLKITPATIFDVRMQNAVPVPVFQNQWLNEAIDLKGDIYNISFASRSETQMYTFKQYVGKNIGKLFVVAAGNNHLNSDDRGVDINDTDLYPQRFGGNLLGPNMITVAAYDGKGLAKFSNYSARYVSIAAPGCSVASWAPTTDGARYEEQNVTGTSFATPIVAHVAAVVKALMPAKFNEPKYVRARILAGADLTAELKGVEDGRLLNPIKTVSLYEDVIEVETDGRRRLLFGKLERQVTINELCEGSGTPAGDVRLLKFARRPNPEAGKDSVVYFLRDGLLDNTKTCQHKSGYLALKSSTGEDVLLNLDEVVDMVLRVRTHD